MERDTQVGPQAVVGAGGREEKTPEVHIMVEDGGREGRLEEEEVIMETETGCGREEAWEEANMFTLTSFIQTFRMEDPITRAVVRNSPEEDLTAAEGDTSWPQDGLSLLVQEPNFTLTCKREEED